MIRLENVGRDFISSENKVTVLNDISLQISKKEFVAITGPSGSGKSTLLGLLGTLDKPSRGKIFIANQNCNQMNEEKLSLFRGLNIGFVFQNFQLIPNLNALENIALPAQILRKKESIKKARRLLKEIGLEKREKHYPHQLSGGEMQRIAIARASIHKPSLLLADEPTGSLDKKSSEIVIKLLQKSSKQATLVLITHNLELAKIADREIQLQNGHIHKIIKRK